MRTASFTPQQVAWLSQLKRCARDRVVGEFNPTAVRQLAEEIVHLVHDPTDLGRLEGWLSEVGVVLVTLLPLKASKLDGAVMTLESGHPLIGLTSRGDRMDGYVFTLLHELAHICLGHLATLGLRMDEDIMAETGTDGPEADANRQAAAWVLPEDALLPEGRPSMVTVLQIAGRYRSPRELRHRPHPTRPPGLGVTPTFSPSGTAVHRGGKLERAAMATAIKSHPVTLRQTFSFYVPGNDPKRIQACAEQADAVVVSGRLGPASVRKLRENGWNGTVLFDGARMPRQCRATWTRNAGSTSSAALRRTDF